MLQIYPQEDSHKIEFSKLIQHLIQQAQNPSTKVAFEQLQATTDGDWIREELLLTKEMLHLIQQALPSLQHHPQLEQILKTLAITGSSLRVEQFFALHDLCLKTQQALTFINNRGVHFPKLAALAKTINYEKKIVQEIDKILIFPDQIKDSASKQLEEIRKNLRTLRHRTDQKFTQLLKKYHNAGYLSDEFQESFLHNRRVLAVLAEKKRNVEGVLHSVSQSGKICFVEPYSLLAAGNEIEALEQEEKKEIYRILKALTAQTAEYLPLLTQYIEWMDRLDFLAAKAKLARALDAKMPQVNQKKQLKIIQGYHPILYLNHQQKSLPIEPLNLELDEHKHVLIISGPNAGGKTVALKTIGLHQLMLQAGLLVPCDERSTYPIIDQLLLDIGDDQSIEAALSTYSSRLKKMKYFLRHTDKNTLFLIDEIGTGSDPELGGAMAEAILEKLIQTGALGAVTTHYSNIKVLTQTYPNVLNACMQYDEEKLQPLYKLLTGKPGSSYTFEVAKKNGLPDDLIKAAKKKVHHQKIRLDDLLTTLNNERLQTEKLQRALENTQEEYLLLKQTYEQKINAVQEKLKIYQENNSKQQKVLDWGEKYLHFLELWLKEERPKKDLMKAIAMQLNSELIKQRKEKEKRTQFKKSLQKVHTKKIDTQKEKIKIGSRVRLKGQKEIGEVISLQDDEATVRFGAFLKLKAQLIDLIPCL